MTYLRERYVSARPLVVRRDLYPEFTGIPVRTDLVVWLDAAQLEFGADDPVDSWPNLAETEDYVQAGGSAQPLFRANSLNGLPGVEFDGVDDHLDGSVSRTLDPCTILAVVRGSDYGATQFIIGNVSGNSALILRSNGNNFQVDREGAATFATNSTTITDSTAYEVDFTYDAANDWLFGLNGSDDGTGNSDQPIAGARICLGARDSFSLPFAGIIYEVAVYSTALGSTDLQTMRDYLTSKWGL